MMTLFKALFQRTDTHEFLPLLAEIEETPVNPLGRVIFWTVTLVFLFVVLWSCFGEIDIVVTSRGKIHPDGYVKTLQPLESGVVSNILVKEGQLVKKGQVLMEIDPTPVNAALGGVSESLALSQAEASRLNAMVEGSGYTGSGSQSALYSSSRQRLQAQLDAKRQELSRLDAQRQGVHTVQTKASELLDVATKEEARLRPVLDIIARDEYDRVQRDMVQQKRTLEEQDAKLREIKEQQEGVRQEMRAIQEEFDTQALEKLTDNEKRRTELEAKLTEFKFKSAKQQIVAPVDGVIDGVFVHTQGGVVNPAQKVFTLVPLQTPLVFRGELENKFSGFVKSGMLVHMKLDTFDYQKYGMIDGKVKHISPDVREDTTKRSEPKFEIVVTPNVSQLWVDGEWKMLKSGMTVTSEIKVGKRRLIELFIYPLIKNWQEGMSVK
ncbi:MAG: HlyD family type I secretion periplasmic adaptor subunit [Vampirovibrionales bacterium]